MVKQADLVFALHIAATVHPEQKARDFDYYESDHRPRLLAVGAIQAIVAAEVGHLELAYDYLTETAFIDLRDHALNTRDGVHLAALAGAWLATVAGFGGMRDHGKTLSFAPRLPSRLTRLRFGLLYRGARLAVEIAATTARLRAARRRAAGDPPPR